MHLPVIFSLMHYLTEQSTLDSVRLGQEENRRAAAQAEMGNLRDAFFGFGSLINGRVLKDLAGQLDASMASSQSISAAMATARERADQLMAELDAVPIIKDGKRL
jgi:hypothetical protein